MAHKIIPFTRIEMENGKEISRTESQRYETFCDVCGKKMLGFLTYGEQKCNSCGKDVCYECRKGGLEIPATNQNRYRFYCPDCVKDREDEAEAVKTLYKTKDEVVASLKAIEIELLKAKEKFHEAKDRKIQNDKGYQDAEKKFKEYQAQVESGKYKSHREMIRKYKALLKTVPYGSKLYHDIEIAIDDHETDYISDISDKARHGEL